jgi:hypothetical protein
MEGKMTRFKLLKFTNEMGEKDFNIIDKLVSTEHPAAWGFDRIIDTFEKKFEKGEIAFSITI